MGVDPQNGSSKTTSRIHQLRSSVWDRLESRSRSRVQGKSTLAHARLSSAPSKGDRPDRPESCQANTKASTRSMSPAHASYTSE
jgi:hypothetical protein